MWRLSWPPRPRWARLRGADGERGGIAVSTALLLPVLLGLTALAVDTTGVWAARQQVVNGADAAVLAVATDCARNSCGDIKQTSEAYFFANNEAAKLADLKAGSGWIYVNGRQVRATGTWLVQHFFAGALGFPTGSLSVESTAAWAPRDRATSDVALAVSWCTYRAATTQSPVGSRSATTSIPLTTSVTGSCAGPSGGSVPRGTAWTRPSSGSACGTASAVAGPVAVPAGGTRPGGCSNAALNALVGQDVVLPVWDATSGGSTPGTVRAYGYAAFRVTAVSTAGATPSLTGWFVWGAQQVDVTEVPTSSAPDLGARSVFLTDPSTWTGQNCRNGSTTCN